MKFRKLDQRQVPQVAVLAVLSVGVLGYGGWSIVSGMQPAAKQAPRNASAETVEAPVRMAARPRELTGTAPGNPGPGLAAPGTPEAAAAAAAAVEAGAPAPSGSLLSPGAGLAPAYNPDPFRSLAPPVVRGGNRPERRVPSASGPDKPKRMARAWPFEGLPGTDGGRAFGDGFAPKPAPPALPPRPELAVTGVIDAEDGKDMALILLGSEQRILQVGDMLPNNYRVVRIALDGVLLVSGSDRFFVALGKKTEPAEAQPGITPGVAAPVQRS